MSGSVVLILPSMVYIVELRLKTQLFLKGLCVNITFLLKGLVDEKLYIRVFNSFVL